MAAKRDNQKKIENKVEAVLKKVRPYIQMHGGDVKLIDLKDDTVFLEISGACAGCPLADLTYNKMICALIKEEAPEIKKVILT